MIFYVYELCYPEGKPFYVGKGSDDGSRVFKRAHYHWRKNQLVRLVIQKLKANGQRPLVKIVFESDDEGAAFEEEVRLIALYGRRFDGGILWNVCLGGRGGPHKGRQMSDETKAKISAANTGRKRSAESRERMSRAQRGKKQSPEHIAKSANSRRGRIVSAETRQKLSASQAGRQRNKASEETRARMSASGFAAWKRRRELDTFE